MTTLQPKSAVHRAAAPGPEHSPVSPLSIHDVTRRRAG
jgi:hypothetical protein